MRSTAELPAGSEALRPLLLSLRPRFAQAILDGTKTVELRRTRVSAPEGTLLILYASAPIMSVVGVARLSGRVSDTPSCIWQRYGSRTGLSRDEYDRYFVGSRIATAVLIETSRPLIHGFTLAKLRESQAGFRPPQSFRYLSERDPQPLRGLAQLHAEEMCGAVQTFNPTVERTSCLHGHGKVKLSEALPPAL